jgi:DNA-binding transcriptional regulator YiaG
MPNIASILKAEIARVARKTVRVELQALKKSAGTHRSEVAALKKRITALELQLRRQDKAPRPGARSANAGATQAADAPSTIRFTAKGLASQRRRLDLSAEQLGQLVGASGQSVYNWESGKARPRAKHLPALAALKTMGKKAAAEQLAASQAPR